MTYVQKIEHLRSLAPKHALLGLLSKGHSQANELVVDRLISQLEESEQDAEEAIPHTNSDSVDDPDDAKLGAMRREQSDLFTMRRRLSNSFHNCKNDRQRAAVSLEIEEVQKNIERVMARIDAYKQLGLQSDLSACPYPIPEHPTDKKALQLSLRSRISQQRKIIREKKNPEQVKKAQMRIEDLKKHLQYVEKSLATDLQP